jgi:hypothetical protein
MCWSCLGAAPTWSSHTDGAAPDRSVDLLGQVHPAIKLARIRDSDVRAQRKKSVSDAIRTCYTRLRRDRRGAKQWVAEVVDLLGFFDPSVARRAVEAGLQMLDQAAGDVTRAAAELQRHEIVRASSRKISPFNSG